MEGERHLFIGGPVDGFWIMVPKQHWTWSIRKLIDPDRKDKKYIPYLLSCNPGEPSKDYVVFEEHRYHREELRDAEGKRYWVFRHYKLDNVIQHLIEGYVGVEADEESHFL